MPSTPPPPPPPRRRSCRPLIRHHAPPPPPPPRRRPRHPLLRRHAPPPPRSSAATLLRCLCRLRLRADVRAVRSSAASASAPTSAPPRSPHLTDRHIDRAQGRDEEHAAAFALELVAITAHVILRGMVVVLLLEWFNVRIFTRAQQRHINTVPFYDVLRMLLEHEAESDSFAYHVLRNLQQLNGLVRVGTDTARGCFTSPCSQEL
ncbi:hypothetical protein [Oryza sativa Japonica Group]|uniref:Uncharacterized protein n=1 Tax=Oryza sativa subsp. japonica TaxID=39947 RepID=Q5VQW6_ORYSJ|nr:hypothetical protein [Oryza sativa Japonica Group]BAD68148.1 hypothetical protein [Oryza sativa Japonica Group]